MKRLSYLFLLVFGILVMPACSNFGELEQNPNRATSVPPYLVFRGVLADIHSECWNDVMRYNQFWCSNYGYYDNNEYNWTGASLYFSTLKNVQKMEEEAAIRDAEAVNPYTALGKYFRAYSYYYMTNLVGDLPLTQALQGDANTAPAYDSQKQIFIQILAWLEASNTELTQLIAANDRSLSGDIYFNNDLRQWQKVVNSFTLRVLIDLSKKSTDAELNVKGKFAAIVGNSTKYPLLEGLDDNMNYVYSAATKYPFNPDNFGFYALRYNTSATYVNNLAALKDPRVFKVAEPATFYLDSLATNASDFRVYVGAPSGESLDDMATKVQAGKYSLINKARYFSSYVGEANIQVGYSEQCFNIAEAINLGWISGDAASYYNKGITASMAFYDITDAVDLTNYLAQTTVAYKGNNADGLNQILLQKYLAFAENSGWEAYINWRRTGIPTFSVGVGTGNSNRIPKRFNYPSSERTNNKSNYEAALTNQFGSVTDDINGEIWLLKN